GGALDRFLSSLSPFVDEPGELAPEPLRAPRTDSVGELETESAPGNDPVDERVPVIPGMPCAATDQHRPLRRQLATAVTRHESKRHARNRRPDGPLFWLFWSIERRLSAGTLSKSGEFLPPFGERRDYGL